MPFLEAYSVEDDVGLTFKVFPFSGLQFYSIFKGMSRDYFNCEIGLRDWRQVAVIFRKTLPDDLVSASLVVSANQANHSAEMQALHYDHHNFETRSCSSDTMLSTLVFSKSWWKYMGVCVDKDLISIAGFKSPSFQSMVMMDDTSLLRSMRLAVSDQDATWKNEFQCRMVSLVSSRNSNLCIVSPTGSGKSLFFIVPSMIEPRMCTVVIVPTVALQMDLVKRCRKAMLSSEVWNMSIVNRGTVPNIMIVLPETVSTGPFSIWLQSLSQKSLLSRVVIEECHLVFEWSSFRSSFLTLRWTIHQRVPLLVLTATLPSRKVEKLSNDLGLLKPFKLFHSSDGLWYPCMRYELQSTMVKLTLWCVE